MTYADIASVYSITDRKKLEERIRVLALELLLDAQYYKRLARIARRRSDTILFREMTIRSMTAECDLLTLLVDCPLSIEQIIGRTK